MKNSIDYNKLQAPLSSSIWEEYQKLMREVETIPENLMRSTKIEGTGGKITIADTLAYQIGWGLLLIGWYTKGLKGEKFTMPSEHIQIWDYTALAKSFYKKHQAVTIQELQKTFSEVVADIIIITEQEYASGNLDKVGVWQWCTLASGKEWPLSKWIQVNTVAPYKRAHVAIRKIYK